MKKVHFYYPLDCILKKERFTTNEQSHKQASKCNPLYSVQ